MALNYYESVGSTLEKIISRDLQGSFQHYPKRGPRTQSSTWDWSKCRFLGPTQLLWSRISILTRSSGDCIHLKVWQALLSATGKDEKKELQKWSKMWRDFWNKETGWWQRGTRRVNCSSKELKGGFLQHELWLEKKKKKQNRAWQLLDFRNKLRKNVKGRKKKENQFLEGVTLNFFRPKKIFYYTGNHEDPQQASCSFQIKWMIP